MKIAILSFSILLAVFGSKAADDIYSVGPYAVQNKLYLSLFTWGLDHNLHVFAPEAPGSFPVVYFIPGIAGIIPVEAYWSLAERIASHGYVVLGIWTLTALPMGQVKAEWLKEIDLWMQEKLNDKLIKDGFNADLVIDFGKIYIMGHSSGSHVTVNYLKLENGCDNIHGHILLSPVDGMDPFGILDMYCIEPGTKVNFETPTLLVSAGLDNKPGIGETGGLYPACAPDELSNLRFWNAFNGEAWLINATRYGHGDVLIDFLADDVIGTLKNCATDREPLTPYHDFLAGEIVAFMRVVEGDCDSIKYLEDTSLMPVEAYVMKQEGGEEVCQGGGYCIKL